MRGRRRGFDIDDLVKEAGLVGADERQLSRQQLIQNHAERVDVGLVRKFLVLHLLRGHVGRRTDPLQVCVFAS
jgi:hypothetical protein